MDTSGSVATYVVWSGAVVCTVVGGVAFWRHEYPNLKDTLNAPLMRLLLLGLSWLAGLLAYIQARNWIMALTEVDPNNFPRALIAFAGLAFPPCWLVITTGLGMLVLPLYLFVVYVIACIWGFIQGLRSGWLGIAVKPPPEIIAKRLCRGPVLFIGIMGLVGITGLLLSAAHRPPFETLFRKVGSNLLVMTDFAYDKTCAVSSQTRWVAPLKDRKDLEGTKILIADASSSTHIQFSIGQCK
jgi:hypothetical protein